MLLPSISNTIGKCLQKTFNFLNTDKPCRNKVLWKKIFACEKVFSGYVQGSKNSLITKLLTNVNFEIFNNKVFLVKLSIS